ncbi:hypothetical protein ACFYY3_30040 [Streptomyces sp. NPDC001812]|uniref:hypothetical protein n=1 Tax=Streptomyces sp. NPDC001812 TaxID=3364611 RepID=UPI0036736810
MRDLDDGLGGDGEVRGDPGGEACGADAQAPFRHDHDGERGAVRQGHALGDPRLGPRGLFHVGGEDVRAVDGDPVKAPAAEGEQTRVQPAQVAGVEPGGAVVGGTS